jgi:hypothetical protein
MVHRKPWLNALAQDARHGLRVIRRSPAAPHGSIQQFRCAKNEQGWFGDTAPGRNEEKE